MPTSSKSLRTANSVKTLVFGIRFPERKVTRKGVQHCIRFQAMLVQKILRNPYKRRIRSGRFVARVEKIAEDKRVASRIERAIKRSCNRERQKTGDVFYIDQLHRRLPITGTDVLSTILRTQ